MAAQYVLTSRRISTLKIMARAKGALTMINLVRIRVVGETSIRRMLTGHGRHRMSVLIETTD